MPNLKHVGRLKNNKRRAIVAYRTIPGDPYSALVILTESLPADEHDSLIKLVESAAGQEAYELADAMSRTYLPDGRNMLAGFHQTGQLKKVSTSDIEMTPDSLSSIVLTKLNEIIAQQRGVSLEDLAVKPVSSAATTQEATASTTVADPVVVVAEQPLSDDDLARKYRSDADRLSKEAANLRRMAEDLVPTKKKSTKTVESA